MTTTGYLLQNARTEAAERFAALSALFDPVTLRQFDACGIAAGWRCWEVGAGGPGLVQAIAARVGPTGHVLATDIDVAWTAPAEAANVDVRRHDVALEPPPGNGFDLVHARLVLVHVKAREQALRHMMAALKPGGWLVIEDADPALQPLSCIDPAGPEEELANRIRQGFRALLAQRGADLSFGRKLPRQFRACGLEQVAAEGYFPINLPPCVPLEIATIAMIRDDLLSHGIATPAEIERHLDNVRAGALDLSQPPMISVRGRKPRATGAS